MQLAHILVNPAGEGNGPGISSVKKSDVGTYIINYGKS